jgi:hypothetical protein
MGEQQLQLRSSVQEQEPKRHGSPRTAKLLVDLLIQDPAEGGTGTAAFLALSW